MRMRAASWVVASVAALTGLFAVPAHAAPPDRSTTTFSVESGPVLDEFLTDACGFDVTALTRGHLIETSFYDRFGQLRVIQSNPSMVTVYEGISGARLETADRGLDKLSLTSDGAFLYFGTGIHLKVKGQDYAVGLWRLTFTQDFDLVNQEYFGNFDVLYPELVPYVCDALDG